jgi:hypothetical protein
MHGACSHLRPSLNQPASQRPTLHLHATVNTLNSTRKRTRVSQSKPGRNRLQHLQTCQINLPITSGYRKLSTAANHLFYTQATITPKILTLGHLKLSHKWNYLQYQETRFRDFIHFPSPPPWPIHPSDIFATSPDHPTTTSMNPKHSN